MPESIHCLVLCTCPDESSAGVLAEKLIMGKLAACVNILPGLRSIYQWRGRLEDESEVLILIKTRTDRYPQLETAILADHPYDVPEVIRVPIEFGSAAYLEWIDSQVKK